jgi:hypothetical protein
MVAVPSAALGRAGTRNLPERWLDCGRYEIGAPTRTCTELTGLLIGGIAGNALRLCNLPSRPAIPATCGPGGSQNCPMNRLYLAKTWQKRGGDWRWHVVCLSTQEYDAIMHGYR